MNDKDIIRLFAKDTENINLLGHLITSKVSRNIMNLISEEGLHASQIAKKLNIDLTLVLHHLKKLEQCNLLIITEKRIAKKGKYHKVYKVIPNIFITISQTKNEAEETGFFKRIFREGIKFIALGISVVFTFFITGGFRHSELGGSDLPQPLEVGSSTYALTVLVIGLTIFYFLKKRN